MVGPKPSSLRSELSRKGEQMGGFFFVPPSLLASLPTNYRLRGALWQSRGREIGQSAGAGHLEGSGRRAVAAAAGVRLSSAMGRPD